MRHDIFLRCATWLIQIVWHGSLRFCDMTHVYMTRHAFTQKNSSVCLYVCVCICKYTQILSVKDSSYMLYVYAYVRMYMHVCICICMRMYVVNVQTDSYMLYVIVYVCMCMYMYVRIHAYFISENRFLHVICMCTCMHLYVRINICIYMYIYVYMCVYVIGQKHPICHI